MTGNRFGVAFWLTTGRERQDQNLENTGMTGMDDANVVPDGVSEHEEHRLGRKNSKRRTRNGSL